MPSNGHENSRVSAPIHAAEFQNLEEMYKRMDEDKYPFSKKEIQRIGYRLYNVIDAARIKYFSAIKDWCQIGYLIPFIQQKYVFTQVRPYIYFQYGQYVMRRNVNQFYFLRNKDGSINSMIKQVKNPLFDYTGATCTIQYIFNSKQLAQIFGCHKSVYIPEYERINPKTRLPQMVKTHIKRINVGSKFAIGLPPQGLRGLAEACGGIIGVAWGYTKSAMCRRASLAYHAAKNNKGLI